MSEEVTRNTVQTQLLRRAVASRHDFEEIFLVPIFAVLIALALGGATMLATGVDLATIGKSFTALLNGSVGSISALSETLTAAAPVTLAALGIALGFRAGLFNIGAEGQLLIGGMAAVISSVSRYRGFPPRFICPWHSLPRPLPARCGGRLPAG